MPLTGQAKTEYQREYMRRYRAKTKDSALSGRESGSENARGLPVVDELTPVRPKLSVRPEQDGVVRPKPQSHSPMMVGYVPPQD